MASLICGSIAYDTIMNFEGRFQDQILPDQIHILNVAFLVPSMRREFGGCAGNIAYNLKLLQGEPVIMATVGGDAVPYLDRLKDLQIDTAHIRTLDGAFTAQAMITTDLSNNQITAFHPGLIVLTPIGSRSRPDRGSGPFHSNGGSRRCGGCRRGDPLLRLQRRRQQQGAKHPRQQEQAAAETIAMGSIWHSQTVSKTRGETIPVSPFLRSSTMPRTNGSASLGSAGSGADQITQPASFLPSPLPRSPWPRARQPQPSPPLHPGKGRISERCH